LPLTSKGNFPVGCVDWCDAHAYCEGVGKRLCGKIGGGTTPPAAFADASQSQWYNACSSGGVNAYPYGKTESQTACDGKNSGNASTVAVGSLKGCQSTAGGYDGIWDMSGNAAEWEDSCEATVGDQDSCHIRGGSFLNYGALSSCTVDYSQARNTNGFSIGFRCCAP
jgi:formylglycine-generating enzyme required for sulfatase activity